MPWEQEVSGQDFRIDQFTFLPDGRVEFVTASDPSAYLRLLQGSSIINVTTVAGMSLDGTVVTRLPIAGNQVYFQLHRVPRDESLDVDRDTLSDVFELTVGLDPFLGDSDGNGINDPDEDLDGDTLAGHAEQAAGTDPFDADSDDDGWPDEAEVTGGSNPTSAASRPILTVLGSPGTELIVPVAPDLTLDVSGLVLSSPSTEVVLPQSPVVDPTEYGLVLAEPGTELVLPTSVEETGVSLGLVLARPKLEIALPTASAQAGFALGTLLGLPPVSIEVAPP
jgi:hypothetical protein